MEQNYTEIVMHSANANNIKNKSALMFIGTAKT